MFEAIGGGLVAAGAVLALFSILFAPEPLLEVGRADHDRVQRISSVTTVVSAATTLAGAILLLVHGAWWWTLAGVAITGSLYYVSLVATSIKHQRSVLQQVRRDREVDGSGSMGRVTLWTAGQLVEFPAGWDHFGRGEPVFAEADNQHLEELARTRATLSLALRHPTTRARRRG